MSRQFEGVLGCRECHVHRPELDDEDFPVDAAKIPEHVLQPLAYLSTWSLGSFGSSKALEVLHVDTDYRTMGREFDMDTKMIGLDVPLCRSEERFCKRSEFLAFDGQGCAWTVFQT